MAANQVCEALMLVLKRDHFDFLVVNFANPDMVGHTGNLNSTIRACETVDRCLGEILGTLKEIKGIMLLVSDHGNSEIMVDELTNMPHTAHTTNEVPIILVGLETPINLANGGLSDVAPTVLDLMDISKPKEMTGKSLIKY
jgi:2,3-bisphosphoglycerate-independent phosphoglycerate mutase